MDWPRQLPRRWLSLFPGQRVDEFLGQPTQSQIDAIVGDRGRIVEIRERLSNPSWFMRALAEPIARLAQHAQEHQHRWRRGQRAVRGIFAAG